MFYDEYIRLCNEKGMSPTAIAKEIGLSGAHVTKWKNGSTPTDATIYRICDHFGLSYDYFDQDKVVTCSGCGFRYNRDDLEEVAAHAKHHRKWEYAIERFGFCWSNIDRERKKAAARNRIADGGLTDSEHFDAQITVFKALFSRSLENADYSTAHVDFATYVAMMLNQDQWKRKIDPHIYNLLVEDYGTKPGIQEGTYYAVPSLPDAAQAIDLASELRIPILGRISAGLPLYAEEHIEGYTLTDLNGGAEYFALKVKGDSMDAIGIKEGYTIIVRRQEEVENGEVAVVMVGDDDATVKRFYSSGVAVTLMPQSTNPIHAPQNYDLSNTGVKVLGKVVEVKFSL